MLMPALSTPAQSQPRQKSAKRTVPHSPRAAWAPATSSTTVATNVPNTESAKLDGKTPNHQGASAAAHSRANATSTGHSARWRHATRGVDKPAQAMTNHPHNTKASAWFKKVAEGETL